MFEEELKNIYHNFEKIKYNRSEFIDDCKIRTLKFNNILEDDNGKYITIFYLNSILGLIKNKSNRIIKIKIMIGDVLISQIKIKPNEYVYPIYNIAFIPNLSLKFMNIKVYIEKEEDVDKLLFYLLEYSVDYDNDLIKYLTDCGNIGSDNYATIINNQTCYLFHKGVLKVKEKNMIKNNVINLSKEILV